MIKAILVEIIWRSLSKLATATMDLIKRKKKMNENQKKAEAYENATNPTDVADTFDNMP